MSKEHQRMGLRFMADCLVAAVVFVSGAVGYHAQVSRFAHTNSASHVAAEIIEGNLSLSASKPGDTLAIRLKEDVRSNGEIIFRKGTTITGNIRNVSRPESEGDWKSGDESIIDIEWTAPDPQGLGVQGVSFALESVFQINRE